MSRWLFLLSCLGVLVALVQMEPSRSEATQPLGGPCESRAQCSVDLACADAEGALEGQCSARCNSDAACQEHHYTVVAQFIVKFIAHLETKPGFLASEDRLLPDGIGLNINYPASDAIMGVKVAVQGQTAQLDGLQIIGNFRCLTGACSTLANPGDSRIGGLQVVPDATPDIKNADTGYFTEGYVTIVPITPDYTAGSELKYKSVLTGFRP